MVSHHYYETTEYWVEEVLSAFNGDFLLTIYVINVTNREPQAVGTASIKLGRVEIPCALYLLVMVNITNGDAAVWLGYAVIENGTHYNEPAINWDYGMPLGPATEVVIAMNPYLATPSGYSYDSELIIGNGLGTAQPFNAQMALLYWNGESFMPVTNTYNFAINMNLTSTYLTTAMCGGLPCVTSGEPNYGQLGAFNALSVPMTYVEWEGLGGGAVHSTYITSPINITYPRTTEPAPGVLMRLTGVWVMTNGSWEFLNTTSVEVTPSGTPRAVFIRPGYSTYYLVLIMSAGRINVNGSLVNNYTGWVRAGSVINITAAPPNYLGNGTRLLPVNGSPLLITVDKPMNITINWVKQYLITIGSEYPIDVNGTITTNYTNWVNACSRITVNASAYYMGNGVRYVATNGTGTYEVCSPPMRITVGGWTNQYLVVLTSPVPILVNGVETMNYTGVAHQWNQPSNYRTQVLLPW